MAKKIMYQSKIDDQVVRWLTKIATSDSDLKNWIKEYDLHRGLDGNNTVTIKFHLDQSFEDEA